MTQAAPASVHTPAQPVGALIRDWRKHRRLSQLDLACEAEISQRHLSFLESGRAQPSREMVLHLAERLDLLIRELSDYPAPAGTARKPAKPAGDFGGVLVPLQLKSANGSVLSLLGTTTVFGTAVDITLAELTLEAFFPADAATAAALGV